MFLCKGHQYKGLILPLCGVLASSASTSHGAFLGIPQSPQLVVSNSLCLWAFPFPSTISGPASLALCVTPNTSSSSHRGQGLPRARSSQGVPKGVISEARFHARVQLRCCVLSWLLLLLCHCSVKGRAPGPCSGHWLGLWAICHPSPGTVSGPWDMQGQGREMHPVPSSWGAESLQLWAYRQQLEAL